MHQIQIQIVLTFQVILLFDEIVYVAEVFLENLWNRRPDSLCVSRRYEVQFDSTGLIAQVFHAFSCQICFTESLKYIGDLTFIPNLLGSEYLRYLSNLSGKKVASVD